MLDLNQSKQITLILNKPAVICKIIRQIHAGRAIKFSGFDAPEMDTAAPKLENGGHASR
jgi:hypothetical protein